MLKAPRLKPIAISLSFGLMVVGVIGLVASFTSFKAVGVLLLPGMLLAAVAVPEGVHSTAFVIYFILAAFTNVLLYSLFPWLLLRRRHIAEAK